MEALRTLSELVAEVTARIAALPAPKNGQVRAVPDERTVRYYGTLGLLARPSATRGRTALYGPRHVAQVVAIKRLQSLGRSLSEIQALWPTLDDQGLTRMSGVAVPEEGTRPEFWRCELGRLAHPADVRTSPPVAEATVELRVELSPGVVLALSAVDDHVMLSSTDVRAIRAASAPLLAELVSRLLVAAPVLIDPDPIHPGPADFDPVNPGPADPDPGDE
jgi:DNA-binding transcriptional MerR regulator